MKKKSVSQQEILEKYSRYVLKNGRRPINVYSFADEMKISEQEFYQYFAGFEAIEQNYLLYFFHNATSLLESDETYNLSSSKERLLSFYFTFFEILSANRSLVLHLLQGQSLQPNHLGVLKPLRKAFLQYVSALKISDINLSEMNQNAELLKNKTIEEAAWLQFLSVLKFWLTDTSAGFEKTDIYIEKSLDVSFELIQLSPIKKIFDLGKFLWKERVEN